MFMRCSGNVKHFVITIDETEYHDILLHFVWVIRIWLASELPKYRYIKKPSMFHKNNTAAVFNKSKNTTNKITKLFSPHLNLVYDLQTVCIRTYIRSQSTGVVRGMQYTIEGQRCGRGRFRAINPNDADKLSSPAVSSHASASLPSCVCGFGGIGDDAKTPATSSTTNHTVSVVGQKWLLGGGAPQYGTAFWQPRPSSGRHERIIFYPFTSPDCDDVCKYCPDVCIYI